MVLFTKKNINVMEIHDEIGFRQRHEGVVKKDLVLFERSPSWRPLKDLNLGPTD